ncbi:MAG: 4-hydroxyphenylacetate 3-hydroxylase N-terminal domain-containing protein, partial [Chloroflexota bacterium]|nr:4-hydroxyphenylacetate 3-hydroxylase N-terminal domain-containing protein [Chloroflexota bacterium]
EKVGRDDSRIAPGVNVMAVTFDIAQDPKWHGVATVKSSITGKDINRWTHLPQHPYDLMQKQKVIRLGTQRVGGCIQRCMGHDAINALAICTKEMDEKNGTEYHRRFMDYLKWFQEKDLTAACGQTDMKGDRTKRPSEQPDPDAYVHIDEMRKDGIVVSGAKISITMAAYADEILVIPTRALRPEDADYAVAFAIPADYEGLKLVTRPVWLRNRKEIKAPFCEFGVSDSVCIFDHLFIPNERVFMCREWDFGRRLALLFADSHRHSYCGCKPAVSDVICGATLLAAEANNIEKVSHVREKLSEFAGGAELAFAAGVAAALYGEKTSSGTFFPNVIYANVGRRLMGETIYHEFNMLCEVAGGLGVTLPFEEEFINPETRPYMDKYIVRNPKISPEDSHRIWRFVENVLASPMSAWYQVAGVHGGGSPIMETIALNIDYDYNARKKVARYLAGIDEDLDQAKDLEREPTFGCHLVKEEKPPEQ